LPIAGIRTTIGNKIHERLQNGPLNRSTVPVINSDNSAQSVTLPSTLHASTRGVLSCPYTVEIRSASKREFYSTDMILPQQSYLLQRIVRNVLSRSERGCIG